MITFLTGSANKFAEIQAFIPDLVQKDMDLPDIPELDPHKVIKAKLEAALTHFEGECIVEDTSLYIEGLGGLPGPLIKWFMKSLGFAGLAELALRSDSQKTEAKTIIGYARPGQEIQYFEGVVAGRIVAPRGDSNFGWEPIFMPDGFDKVFAEMTFEEKNACSMRGKAAEKLRDFLGQS